MLAKEKWRILCLNITNIEIAKLCRENVRHQGSQTAETDSFGGVRLTERSDLRIDIIFAQDIKSDAH